MPATASTDRPPTGSQDHTAPPAPRGRFWLDALAPRNIGAVYVWALIIVLFTVLSKDFLTADTARSVLNQYSITGLVALSLVVPLAAGSYDLSIGFVVSLASVLVASLLDKTHWSPVLCVLVTLAVCVCVGLLNAFVVVGLGVDSFIGTLGTGAIVAAVTLAISSGLTVTGRVGEGFTGLATPDISGVQLPVFYLLAVMLVIGWWLERTQTGRRLYAIGYDQESARLSGVPVDRLRIVTFVVSSTISGFAGMVLAARVASGSPDAGSSYLIPAFSAAFLGSTQLRRGRFNPWGTVIAVLLVGTGNVGLLLVGGPIWTPQLFEGTVLIAAVALTGFGTSAVGGRLALLRTRRAARRTG